MLRLVTIPISHYCEKARWALERAGIAYREERHVQAIHRIAARRAGGGATVPVLVTPDGVLGESEEILAWVDERTPPEHRLYPAESAERAEVERLCRRFDDGLGPTGRRLMYVHMLAQPELMLDFNNQGVPRWEDRALRLGWPLAVRWARRQLGIHPGTEVEDEAAVWREFDFVAELLGGRPRAPVRWAVWRRRPHVRGALGIGRRATRLRGPSPPARRPASAHRRARRTRP